MSEEEKLKEEAEGKTQAKPESEKATEEKPKEAKPAPKPKQRKSGGGRKHESTKVYNYFDGKNGKRLKKHCPRCGPGTWMSEHDNRHYCGRCGYTEFSKKKEE